MSPRSIYAGLQSRPFSTNSFSTSAKACRAYLPSPSGRGLAGKVACIACQDHAWYSMCMHCLPASCAPSPDPRQIESLVALGSYSPLVSNLAVPLGFLGSRFCGGQGALFWWGLPDHGTPSSPTEAIWASGSGRALTHLSVESTSMSQSQLANDLYSCHVNFSFWIRLCT